MNSVGYKRPPRHTQFKPGVSGNAGGRPRRERSFLADLEAELAATTRVSEPEGEIVVTKQRALARKLVTAALEGNLKAAAAVISIAGTPAEPFEASTSNDDADREALEAYIEAEVQRRLGEKIGRGE